MTDFFHKNMIIDYFKTLIVQNFAFNPTPEQADAINALARFVMYDSAEMYGHTNPVFVLRGYAGTGKTSLVGALVKTMEQLERQCVLLAPTGRAAKVFSLYAGHPAYTIHKRIYRQKSMELDSPFSLDFNSMKHTLFIVDEASMISSDNNMFSSRSLLDDLVEFVYSGEGCRLILLGDTAQLPPVGEYESPALQPNVLSSLGLDVTCRTLTQVVRQQSDSGILSNATYIREKVCNEDVYEMPSIEFTQDVVNVPGSELIEQLMQCYHDYGTDDTIVVTRSNKRANIYNNGIRTQILDRDSELSAGDLVMIAKNNYYWLSSLTPSKRGEQPSGQSPLSMEDGQGETSVGVTSSFLANGDIAQVIRVRNERSFYGFRFADAELRLPDYDDLEIEAVVLLDTLHSEAPALTHEQNELLFNKVMEDYMDIPYKRDRLKKIKEDPYYNALQIKYAYAVTCHKAQGGQWSQVFIDQGYISDDMLGIDYYRWLYTAFTRATDKVYLVNWKKSED